MRRAKSCSSSQPSRLTPRAYYSARRLVRSDLLRAASGIEPIAGPRFIGSGQSLVVLPRSGLPVLDVALLECRTGFGRRTVHDRQLATGGAHHRRVGAGQAVGLLLQLCFLSLRLPRLPPLQPAIDQPAEGEIEFVADQRAVLLLRLVELTAVRGGELFLRAGHRGIQPLLQVLSSTRVADVLTGHGFDRNRLSPGQLLGGVRRILLRDADPLLQLIENIGTDVYFSRHRCGGKRQCQGEAQLEHHSFTVGPVSREFQALPRDPRSSPRKRHGWAATRISVRSRKCDRLDRWGLVVKLAIAIAVVILLAVIVLVLRRRRGYRGA